jgi:Lar family restriction alleviation protein
MTESEIRSKLSPALTGPRILPDKDYIKAEGTDVFNRYKVLPCPFCGEIPSFVPVASNYGYGIYCPVCEFCGPLGFTKDMAIKSWNVRGGV